MVPSLPVEEVLADLKQQLAQRDAAVLEAPPGAGKTTLVPPALVDEPWLAGKKILMLEPRRIATRSAAHRMASLLGEEPGGTVGYRMRLDTRVGKRTRIEIISEGILTRMLQQDPSLADVGLVIFDEFHERSLDSDLALALCLQGRALFRDRQDPLKLLVMSATLDTGNVAALLEDAPVVRSLGRQYPVEVVFGRAAQARESIVERAVATVLQALADHPESSILVFLPGQAEIKRAHEGLADALAARKFGNVQLHPLYGNLSIEEQQRAIAPPAAAGARKVVIATNIAETSLTIEGVDVVVDAGLARVPVFDPGTGMTRLQTRKISQASSVQRMGRAGRLGPGTCYRLWSEAQQRQLVAHTPPEILNADLAPLALQLLQWGAKDPAELRWLDAPPLGPWQQALELLTNLGALTRVNGEPTLTAHGLLMAGLSVHPRLGHLLLCGVAQGCIEQASLLAAMLSERMPLDESDAAVALAMLQDAISCPARHRGWQHRTRQLARQFANQVATAAPGGAAASRADLGEAQLAGYLLACAYPDRIARRRHSGGYQLANGRSAQLADASHLVNARWLAVADLSGGAGRAGDLIRTAAALDPDLFDTVLEDLTRRETTADWDKQSQRFVAEERRYVGALVLERQRLASVPEEAKRRALLGHVRIQGLMLLPWNAALRQWQARVELVRAHLPQWPDVSDAALLETLDDWLGPHLDAVTTLADFKKLDLAGILKALLPWDLARELDALAPERLQVPSGSRLGVDYTQSPPVLAVKLQEMFGCEQTPSLVGGRVSVRVHLLSPAGRPVQVTQDLAGFWRSSYHEVRRDMKGRYPKHPWPEDPLTAQATRRTKGKASP
jgi:ATP-dependent helicase HrpB